MWSPALPCAGTPRRKEAPDSTWEGTALPLAPGRVSLPDENGGRNRHGDRSGLDDLLSVAIGHLRRGPSIECHGLCAGRVMKALEVIRKEPRAIIETHSRCRRQHQEARPTALLRESEK